MALVPPPRKSARLAFAVVALLAAHAPASASLVAKEGTRPNVLLISVDTLRADHLGAYGYPLPTSPEIDRIAREGVLLTDAITPVPTTAPALASLLTSKHADGHTVRENFGELPDAITTIAEAFSEAGYDTAAFYGNGAIKNGFGQGFETFEPFADHWYFRDRAGGRKALAWLKTAEEPWFLWVHFMDPHGPYDSSPPERSASFEYEETPLMLRELPRIEQNYGIDVLPKYQQLPEHARVVDYVRRYDGEIVGTDVEIGRLRTALEKSGTLDRTLLVLTADHGESLGEQKYFFQHGAHLSDPSVRVPLVFRHPRLPAGTRNETPASLVDVFPTIAALAGVAVPDGLVGRDLSTALEKPDPSRDHVRTSYTVTPSQKTAVRRGHWELRGHPKSKEAPDDFERIDLYDLRTSPPRRVPADDEAEVRAALRPLLIAAAREVRQEKTTPRIPTEAEKARLRALGYID